MSANSTVWRIVWCRQSRRTWNSGLVKHGFGQRDASGSHNHMGEHSLQLPNAHECSCSEKKNNAVKRDDKETSDSRRYGRRNSEYAILFISDDDSHTRIYIILYSVFQTREVKWYSGALEIEDKTWTGQRKFTSKASWSRKPFYSLPQNPGRLRPSV